MHPSNVSRKLGLINGCFFGEKITHLKPCPPSYGDQHEDVERTLLYWERDQIILRFQGFAVETRFGKHAGGLQGHGSVSVESRRSRHIQKAEAARKLVKRFGQWCFKQGSSVKVKRLGPGPLLVRL